MKKQAIGIAINGKDVKIAQLIRDNKEVSVSYLETITLNESLDYQEHADDAQVFNEDPTDDAFGSPDVDKDEQSDGIIAESAGQLYDALRKFSASKINVGFNAPPSHVTYQELNTTLDYNKNAYKGPLKKKIELWKNGFDSLENVFVLTRTDGTMCNISLKSKNQPQVLGLLLHLNTIMKNKFHLASMMPNEIALVNLARQSYHSRKGEITIIIQVEEDFSRLIFMDGNDMIAVSPIISDVFTENLNETLYSKILYELDNREIDNVKRILLACRAISEDTAAFFEEKFHNSSVGYIVSQPLAQNIAKEYSRNALSEYALAIAMAWQVLNKKEKTMTLANLLPKDVIRNQKSFQLNFAGITLLFILTGSVLFFSSAILQERFAIYRTEKKIEEQKRQISENEKYIDRVNELAEEIEFLEKSISVSDSVGRGFDDVLSFLEQAHQGFQAIPNIWVENLAKNQVGYQLSGQAFHKIAIPQTSNMIGNSVINSITRTQTESGNELFAYELDVAWHSNSSVFDLIQYQKPDTIEAKKAATRANDVQLDKANSVVSGVNQIKERVIQDVNKAGEKMSKHLASRSETVLSQQSPSQMTKRDSIVTVIVYRYDDRESAVKDSLQMQESGYKVFITDAINDAQGKKYWLCMGSFPSRQKAEEMINQNGSPGLPDSDIVTIPWPFGENFPVEPMFIGGASGKPLKRERVPSKIPVQNPSQSSSAKPQKAVEVIAVAEKMEKPSETRSLEKSKLSKVIRVSAHAVKITADQEILYLRKKGIESYYIYEPRSSAPYWVCIGRFANTAEAVQEINVMRHKVQREYEIINIPNEKLKQNRF